MTARRILLSGQYGVVDTTDGVYLNIGYLGAESVFETAAWGKGASIANFGGHIKIPAHVTDFPPRAVTIDPLYVINGSGAAELHQRAHDLWYLIQGRPGRIQEGSLYLPVTWDGPPKNKARFESTNTLEMTLSGEVLPSYWIALYGYQVGRSQSIYVIDDRLDHTSLIATAVDSTGRVFTVSNPGTAPTNASLTLTTTGGDFTADKTIYIRNVHAATSARVAAKLTYASTAGKGYAYISAAMGLVLMPGTNTLRIENQDGTLETVTDSAGTDQVWKHGTYGTEARYLGNETDLFNEGPAVWSVFRRRGATYYSSAATVSSATDSAARIGMVPWVRSNVEDAYTAASAGLVLEGEIANLCTRSEELDHSAWSPVGSGVTITANDATTDPFGTTKSERFQTTATTLGGRRFSFAVTNAQQYTFSCWIRGRTATSNARIAIADNGGTLLVSYEVAFTTTWRRIAVTATANSSLNHDARVISHSDLSAADVLVVGMQIENLPFASSYIVTAGSSVSRYADFAAVWAPHNYLKYSRDLTQNATTDTGKWVKSVSTITIAKTQTVADGTAFGDLITWNAVGDSIYQSVTLDVRPNSSINGIGTGWAAVVVLRKGNMVSGNKFELELRDQGGTAFSGTTTDTITIDGDDLSATESRSFLAFVESTDVPAATTGFRVYLQSKTGGGTNGPVVESVRFVRGKFPGRLLATEGSIGYADPAHWEWPFGWQQNGYVEFDAVLPPISTGKTYYVFGDSQANAIALYRDSTATTGQNYLKVARRGNGGILNGKDASASVNIDVGNVWDGTLKTFRIEWLNFTRSGTQYMYIRLYVGGVLKTTDTNLATASVTYFVPGERLVMSDGEVYATIRNFKMNVPTWTAGDIPNGTITP